MGNKYKKGLVKDIEEKKEFQKAQNRLKERHHIDQEEVIVVEKSNMTKFLIQTAGNIIRIIAGITVFAFAVIGMAAMIYPDPRMELIEISKKVIEELLNYLP